jgi:hypothetical protein
MNQFCIHILPLLPKLLPVALALAIVGVTAGCATTSTEPEDNDPLERANRAVYGFNDPWTTWPFGRALALRDFTSPLSGGR